MPPPRNIHLVDPYYAPIEGKVQDLLVSVGNTVEAKDLIAVIA